MLASSTFSPVEYSALGELYNSTNGEYWLWSTSEGFPWLFSDDANPCTDNWQGVSCMLDSIEYHVIALNLSQHRLNGPLTDSIGNLTHLVSLDLSSNQLQNTIPASITNLTNLQHLDLSENYIDSTIPYSIGSLSALQYLDFHTTGLYGSIPHSFGDLLQLQYLDIHFNSLTNSIPDSLCALSELQVVLLYENFINGSIPSEIGNLARLQAFDLSNNQLSGAIPDSIGHLTVLRSFALSNNRKVYSTMPASIAHLTQLQNLAWDDIGLFGSMPDAFANLTHLEDLRLEYNNLTGPLPESLCQLTQLQTLELQGNSLTGSIPEAIGNLQELQYLDLTSNHLRGTIPSSITTLRKLGTLAFTDNRLVGTIPRAIGDLTQLTVLSLDDNQLTGSIPECIGQLSWLFDMEFSSNSLNGTIPATVGLLSNLATAVLNGNSLSGSLPSTLCNLPHLKALYLYENALTGLIPLCIGDLSKLQIFYAYTNKLSGPLPDSVGRLTSLHSLYLYGNALTGTLPATIANISFLSAVFLHHNQLEGEIPAVLCNVTFLHRLELNNNKFTGTIPFMGDNYVLIQVNLASNYLVGEIADTMSSLWTLQTLNLSYNRLTGEFPVSLFDLWFPSVISLTNNHLTGSLPEHIDGLWSVSMLELGYNHFTGPLPASLSNLSSLNVLSLQGNKLSGSLEGVFTANMLSLVTIQFDYNPFTGSLPTALFELPAITSVSIVGSCIHGTLPGNICNATSLEALILYGLTTGKTCPAKALSIDTTSTRLSFGGTLPACVLAMPLLRTLLLAGNGLTGYLGADWAVNEKMIQLDLSHNRLSGSIPNAVQNHTWLMLDLSHNKLRGVLREGLFAMSNNSFTAHSKFIKQFENLTLVGGTKSLRRGLSLKSNRLSGYVPNSIKSASDLTVLAGNLFQCALDKQDLPQQDGDIDTYQCASNSFDVSIYVWLGLCVIAALLVAVLLRRYSEFSAVFRWSKLSLPEDCTGQFPHLQATIGVYQLILRCSLLSACFVVTILLPYYAIMSHFEGTHNYQYAYILSGIYTSGVAPFVLSFLFYAALVASVYYYLTQHRIVGAEDARRYLHRSRRMQQAVWVMFALINVVVVLGANIAFVYIVLYQNSNAQTLAQVGMSLFKTLWNTCVAPRMIRRLDASFVRSDSDTAEQYFSLQLIVALFNNIAIPCFVVVAIDPNCFSYAILPPATDTVYYFMQVCEQEIYGVTCGGAYEQASLQFTPPFTYSYQCSASFITSYAPAFIYMSVSTMFISPVLQLWLLAVYQRWESNTVSHKLAAWMLSLLLQPPQPANSLSSGRRIVGAVSTLVTLLTHFGILLTFGVIFPPVAVAMVASIAAVVYMTQYKIERFANTAQKLGRWDCMAIIEQECRGVGRREHLKVAAGVLVCFACTFYSLFLFDALADAQGFAVSFWVLIVVPVLPMALLAAVELYHFQLAKPTGTATDPIEGIELTRAPAPLIVADKKEHTYCEDNECTVSALHGSGV